MHRLMDMQGIFNGACIIRVSMHSNRWNDSLCIAIDVSLLPLTETEVAEGDAVMVCAELVNGILERDVSLAVRPSLITGLLIIIKKYKTMIMLMVVFTRGIQLIFLILNQI